MTRGLSGGNATPPGITSGTAGDHGVGATRFLGLAGTRVHKTILGHDKPRRSMDRVDATSIPIASAIVETWRFEKLPDGTQVRWTTLAIAPTTSFSLLPFRQTTIDAIWPCGMRNLGGEHGVFG
jgi:hypothetical protein